jgi:hypothetical protein
MSCTPYIAKPILTPRDAIASHVRWKITLLTAARMHESLSDRATHSVQHPNQCDIRRWLLSRYTLHLRQTPEYLTVLHWHQEFHREMQTIVSLINAGEFATAERVLNSSESFRTASNSLANAIMALDRIVPVSLAS